MDQGSLLYFLINPGSGHERAILAPLNRCFADSDVRWDVGVLQRDQERAAVEKALQARPDMLIVWGGDGTVAKVVTALVEQGVDIPLLPLHGGTANALATHLNTPVELSDAIAALLRGGYSLFKSDVGFARDQAFLLRVSIGFAAGFTEHATRDQKEWLGPLAYALSTLQAVRDVESLQYTIEVDGESTTHRAIACIVANSSGTGLRSPLASDLDESDSRLETLIVPDMSWAARALANLTSGSGLMDGAPRWSGRRVSVSCERPVTVHADGECIGTTPVDISLQARAVRLTRFEVPG